jgi:hypothetical protein
MINLGKEKGGDVAAEVLISSMLVFVLGLAISIDEDETSIVYRFGNFVGAAGLLGFVVGSLMALWNA